MIITDGDNSGGDALILWFRKFGILTLQQSLINGVWHEQASEVSLFLLANSEDASESLLLAVYTLVTSSRDLVIEGTYTE